jgi:hypothetical protein
MLGCWVVGWDVEALLLWNGYPAGEFWDPTGNEGRKAASAGVLRYGG